MKNSAAGWARTTAGGFFTGSIFMTRTRRIGRRWNSPSVFPPGQKGLYDGEIAYVDVWVGRVIEDLRRRGLLERTLVIVAGDHGEAFGEHGEQGHGIFCYQETLKVPLIFYAPGLVGKPRRVSARVNLTDVMPTVLDLLKMQIPGPVQGRSFLGLLDGHAEKEERTFYFESLYGREEMNWAPLTGLLYGDFKYISLPEPELYDLRADRAEKRNLFLKKNLLARDLDKRLAKFVADHSQRGERNAPGIERRRQGTAAGPGLHLGLLQPGSHDPGPQKGGVDR